MRKKSSIHMHEQKIDKSITMGVWLDFKYQPELAWRKYFAKLKNAGIKEFFVNANVDQLKFLVKIAKDVEVNIHGWIWTLNRPYDKNVMKNKSWYSVNKNGDDCSEYRPYVDYYQWISPFSQGAREYVKTNISKIASIEGIASVHLDYVRYCDLYLPDNLQEYYNLNQDHEMPEYDFGYHPKGRSRFKDEYGIDPIEIDDHELALKWKQFRLDALSSLVQELKVISQENNTKISAAVFPYPKMSSEMVLQDWSNWDLDIVCPMNYHIFYNGDINWIGQSVSKGVKFKKPGSKYLSGMFVDWFDSKNLKKAIEESLNKGADGICLFNSEYIKDNHLKVLSAFK